MGKLSIMAELMQFLKVRKKLWLSPLIFFLVFIGILIAFSQSSVIAPFIYALF